MNEPRPATPPRSVVILGATSPIARAAATAFARNGWGLLLAARDHAETEAIAADLRIRGTAPVWTLDFDALAYEDHQDFVDRCFGLLGDALDGVLLCFGNMRPQADAQAEWEIAASTIETNYTAAVSLMERFAAQMEERKSGWLCGVSSVAGDRGRQSNYIYGSAKAAFTTYLAGLRNRLHPAGVHVVTIKPGPVDTPMTFGMDKLPLLAQPDAVGVKIYNAIVHRKNVVYIPAPWKYIMTIIRHIPEWQFKKMKM